MQRLVIMKAMALRILMASPATMIQMPRVYHSSYSNNPVQEHVVNTMLYHPHDPAPLPFSLLSFENPKRACMPALVICSVCGACGHILRHARCLQPTFCRACGACGEEEDHAACDPTCEEIKCKEKTRSCLNQTGSDFSLYLTWPMRPVHVFIGSVAT